MKAKQGISTKATITVKRKDGRVETYYASSKPKVIKAEKK